ncbi:uncharacterized protein LY79DRAFT_532217 [Colletotrichum navitas]|uniref:Uncharacterized protein n=1 Tax=Colletotrichum navitas TaxID=681940 RepID=A0AAD8QDH2_9PEZI|nr:uncharacterized protein LY79DRAFT_532217 [Colletotrichum navitas]KAK1599996.1 hypothetical protein LY79DRAFT_532217 [Colletotrichum navitas]
MARSGKRAFVCRTLWASAVQSFLAVGFSVLFFLLELDQAFCELQHRLIGGPIGCDMADGGKSMQPLGAVLLSSQRWRR